MSVLKSRKVTLPERHPTDLMMEDTWRYTLFAFITALADWCSLRSTCKFFLELSSTECNELRLRALPETPRPCPWRIRHLHLTHQADFVVFTQWEHQHLDTLEIDTNVPMDVTIPPSMTIDVLRLNGVLPEDVIGDFKCRELSVKQVIREGAAFDSDLDGLSRLVQTTGARRVCVTGIILNDFGGSVPITSLNTREISLKAMRQICPDSLLFWSTRFSQVSFFNCDMLPVFPNVTAAVFRLASYTLLHHLARINRYLPHAKISIFVEDIFKVDTISPMRELRAHIVGRFLVRDTDDLADGLQMYLTRKNIFHPQTTVEFTDE